MNRRGFTLVEIIVVSALIGIMFTIATMQFSDYIRKGAIESQTKELYSDLMVTRSAAVTQHSTKRVVITPTSFSLISSSIGGGVTSGRTTKKLSKPVTWAGKSASDTQTQIIFDERGTFNIDVSNGNTSICVDPSLESAQLDSIVVFSTRIHLGKVGGDCDSDHITIK